MKEKGSNFLKNTKIYIRARERAAMTLDDLNIPSDQEEGSLDGY